MSQGVILSGIHLNSSQEIHATKFIRKLEKEKLIRYNKKELSQKNILIFGKIVSLYLERKRYRNQLQNITI